MSNKTILLTGSAGFLGREIYAAATKERIITLSRQNASIICDLSKQIPEVEYVHAVVHAAGLAHVIARTEDEARMFYDMNVLGTVNLLKGLDRNALPDVFIFISSVSVYGLKKGTGIREDAGLFGEDPYAKSKIEAERTVREWCDIHNVTCYILRLPLLVGEQPKGNLKAMVQGIKSGKYVNLGGGKARKSMVLARDVAKLIYRLCDIGKESGIYHLTDGVHPSFYELSHTIASRLSRKSILNVPLWIASIMAKLGDIAGEKAPFNSHKLSKMICDLTFDDSKARSEIGWEPEPVLSAIPTLKLISETN
jgi:nucleoside-diphosphate-sugar epimerase